MKTHDQLPRYDYPVTGLEVRTHVIGQDEEDRVSHHEVPPIDKTHESWQRVAEAIAAPRTEGRFGFAVIPPADGRDSGTVETYFFPWGSGTANPVGANEMAAYAAAHPENAIVAVDSPATGGSRRLESSVSREIARTGSYLPYGELFVNEMMHVLGDYRRHVFAGSSQGARRAIAATACMGELMGQLTDELNVQEPVGSRHQPLLALMRAFVIREGAHNVEYTKASPDRFAAETQAASDAPLRMALAFGKLAWRGGLFGQIVREPQAMAKGGLRDDLLAAAPFAKEITVSSAERSELSRPEDVRRILEEVKKVSPGTEVVSRLLMGQSHAMNAGNPGVLGVALRRAPDVS